MKHYIYRASLAFALALTSTIAQSDTIIGSLEGDIEVNQGVVSWGMGLDLPSGLNGITPGLSFKYNQSGNNGTMGVGFALAGLSSIARCPATKEHEGQPGGIRFDEKDRYCIDGQRLIAINGADGADGTEYRTATESFSRIISYGSQGKYGPSNWKVWDKSGSITEYGNTANTRITARKADNAALIWNVSKHSDRFNNSINYTYSTVSGISAIKKIAYSGHSIEFVYEARPDKLQAWQMGESHRLTGRLNHITVKASGYPMHEYQLAYEQIASGNYSRLKSIKLCTDDGSCTKPTKFNWKQGANYDESQQQIDILGTKKFSTYRLVDLNRDGAQDLCYLKEGLHCVLNDGSGQMGAATKWTTSLDATKWSDPDIAGTLFFTDLNKDSYPDYCIQDNSGTYCGLHDKNNGFQSDRYWSNTFNRKHELRYADLNNDRLVDICRITPNKVQCAYNTGTTYGSIFTLLNNGWKATSDHNPSIAFVDIDADGLPDLCGTDSRGFRCALLQGYGEDGKAQYAQPTIWDSEFGAYKTESWGQAITVRPQWNQKSFSQSFRYTDLNADGIIDACYTNGASYLCGLNKGTGFDEFKEWGTTTVKWDKPPDNQSYNTPAPALQLTDINGDSRPDLCVAEAPFAYSCGINTGIGFTELTKYADLLYSEDTIKLDNGEEILPHASPLQISDVNGDGGKDICYRSYNTIACALGYNIDHSLLTKIETGYNNIALLEYGQISDPDLYTDVYDAQLPIIDLHGNRRVLKSVSTSNAIGGYNTISYHYEGLKWHEELGSLGYRKIIRRNDSTHRVIETEYHQDNDFRGQTKSVREYVDIGGDLRLLQENFPEYTISKAYNNQVKTIHQARTVNKSYDLGSLVSTKTSHNESYDDWGNVTKLVTSTFNSNEEHTQVTESEFSNDETSWLLGKPTSVTVTHTSSESADPITRQTQFEYDTTSGALVKEILEPGTVASLISTFTYDNHGNRVSTTTQSGDDIRTAHVEYDNSGFYVIKRINNLGHSETISYDKRCGAANKQTGPNGLSTTLKYDNLCRKVLEERADGTTTTWQYSWSSGYDSGYGEQDHSVYTITETSSATAPKTAWFDALGREVRTKTIGFNKKPVFQDKVYDTRGKVMRATLPYYEGYFPGDNTYWVRSEYDEVGRTTAQYKPGEDEEQVTRYGYDGLTSTVTDPLGRTKTTIRNLLDKPVSVQDAGGTSILYTYNAIGDLIETNTDGYIVSMSYDERGNKIAMEDPSMGAWQYRYNGLGELIWQKDAKGQITTQRYDNLGRMVSRTDDSGTSTWIYDTAKNGIGKIHKESNASATRIYSYDALGRPTETVSTIENRSFTSKVGYDKFSRPNKATYPDGMEIVRDYTDEGHLKRISIPKKHVWDYDYIALEESVARLAKEIARLGKEAVEHEENYKKFLAKADQYRLSAEHFEQISEEAARTAVTLRKNADYLYKVAAAHQRKSAHFGNLSAKYRKGIYKNLTFRAQQSFWTHGASGYVLYQASVCTRRNRKGKCKSYHYFNVQVSVAELGNPRCQRRTGKWGGAWCYYSVPRTLNLGNFYKGRSNAYKSIANQKRAQARQADRQAGTKERQAALWEQRAEENKQLALEQIAKAREETDALREIMNLVEDYTEARDGMERALDAHNNNEDLIVLWEASGRDASGRLRTDWVGNGLITTREFDPYNGHLRRITTGIEAQGNLIRDIRYEYDAADNVTHRAERYQASGGLVDATDNYLYDSLDRLIQVDHAGGNGGNADFSRSYQYDIRGNMTWKSDAGSMTYDEGNRLLALEGSAGYRNYTYDNNGNTLSDGKRNYTWNAFNKIDQIKQGKKSTRFSYGPGNNRVKQMLSTEGKSEETFYVSKDYEYVVHNENLQDSYVQMKHHIYAGKEVVAIQVRTLHNNQKQPDVTRYLHKDALGSVDTITDAHGKIVLKAQYDAFGKRKVTLDKLDAPWTNRGYTGHEHLSDFGLIHMNARIYDPIVGRFLSADTFIQAADNSQSYNRYSYVLNNPLKYTDPSGHFFWVIAAIILSVVAIVTDIPILDTIATIVVGVALNAFTFGLGTGFALSFLKGAIAGFVGGLASGGGLKGALRGALFAGLSAGVANFVGHGGLFGLGDNPFGAAKFLVHGVTQGAISELRGGDFKSGFIGAIVGSVSGFVSSAIKGITAAAIAARAAIAAVFGGLAAKATGGSYQDGALSAAMTYLFNEAGAMTMRGAGTARGATSQAIKTVAKRLAVGWVAALVEPTPFGEAVMGLTTAYAIYMYGPEIYDKMWDEIEGIQARYKSRTLPPSMVYSLRAKTAGVYTCFKCSSGTISLKAGDVWKYGETTTDSRYGSGYLNKYGVFMKPEAVGINVMQGKLIEKTLIYGYAVKYGRLPPGNKIFR